MMRFTDFLSRCRAGLTAIVVWTSVSVFIVIAAGGNAQAGPGPIGTYYITDVFNYATGGATLDAIQGSSINYNSAYTGVEGPIAVFASPNVVRTTGQQGTYYGGEYTGVDSLTVTKDGTTLTSNFAFQHFFFDGTTNGVNNFAVEFGNSGAVVSTDTQWGGPVTVLFYTGDGSDYGITYDKWNNSLWIQSYATGVITDYTMTGTILSSFGDADGGAKTALAMDVDRTLWFEYFGTGVIEHYDVNGNFLGTASYTGLGYAHGGEIAQDFNGLSTPEPSTMVGFASAGLVTLGAVARRRRRV